MPVHKTSIDGFLIIRWKLFEDGRGFFKQSYQAGEIADALGRAPKLGQGNHSRSRPKVLRGFHREPWDKLVYVVRGTALCAVADTRPDSPTFGKAETILLGDAPGERARLFISQGLANAFYCFSETDYINDVSEEFRPEGRGGVIWNDPTLAIDWPDKDPILSQTDTALPTLRDLYPDHAIFR